MAKDFLQVIDAYQEATGHKKYEMREVAQWGLQNGHLETPLSVQLSWACRQLADAAGSETAIDADGIPYRTKMAIPQEGKQQFFWCNLKDATPMDAYRSFYFRWRRCGDNVKQLKNCIAHYNKHCLHDGEKPIQFNFDFTEDEPESGAA